MLKNKHVLLVMGGLPQVCDIVEDAKRKGLYVIVTDNISTSPAKEIADESSMVSITDVDGIVELCKSRNVDGIMNYCIDPGQKPYQEICEKLSLPCYGTKKQFEILTNKDLFKEYCIMQGVDVVQSYNLSSECTSDDLIDTEFPVVVKPADGRASKGITVCQRKEDVSAAIHTAMSFSKRGKVVCERYMIRPEVAVKYFVCNGNTFLTSMSDIHTCYSEGKRAYISTQTFPSKYYRLYKETTDTKVRNMISNLDIQNGPLSFSGFVDEGKFCFIDPSFRMGGAQDWRIVAAISGVNISELLTNFALTGEMGDCSEVSKVNNKFAEKSSAMLYFLVRDGKIGKIIGLNKAIKLKSIVGYHVCHREGDTVSHKGTSDHVLMRILLVCQNNMLLKEDITYIQSVISITDNCGKEMLLPNFDVKIIPDI